MMRRRHISLIAALAAAGLGATGAAASTPSPPPNDNYLGSTRIPAATHPNLQTYNDSQDLTAATTQSDLFNPDATGQAFGGGGPEPLTCHGTGYGKTIWYDLHPAVPESVEILTSGVPTAIAVYRWSPTTSKIVSRVGCQVQKGSGTNDFVLPFDLQKGKRYTVQIGGLQTAAGVASGPVSVTVNIALDRDGDGVLDAQDTCPTVPGVPRFGGCPPAIASAVKTAFQGATSGLLFKVFDISGLPGGARARVRCSCGVHQDRTAGPRASSVSLTSFIDQVLPFGSTVEIWVTKGRSGHGTYRYGAIGDYRRYKVQSAGLNLLQRRCLMPGSLTPQTQCPAGGRHQTK
jgi:hypothetical protein